MLFLLFLQESRVFVALSCVSLSREVHPHKVYALLTTAERREGGVAVWHDVVVRSCPWFTWGKSVSVEVMWRLTSFPHETAAEQFAATNTEKPFPFLSHTPPTLLSYTHQWPFHPQKVTGFGLLMPLITLTVFKGVCEVCVWLETWSLQRRSGCCWCYFDSRLMFMSVIGIRLTRSRLKYCSEFRTTSLESAQTNTHTAFNQSHCQVISNFAFVIVIIYNLNYTLNIQRQQQTVHVHR